MNIKNTVTLSDRHLRYAEELVENGQFPSVEKVVEAGLETLMQAEEPAVDLDEATAAEIRRRLNTPEDQWISMDGEAMAERIKAKL